MDPQAKGPQFPELSLQEAARTHGNSLALVIRGQRYTYEELNQKAERKRRTINEHWDGQRALALHCSQDLDALLFLFACLERRVPLLLLHPKWSEPLLDEILTRVSPLMLWKEGGTQQGLQGVPSQLAEDTQILLATSGSSAAPKIVQLGSAGLIASAQASMKNLPWQDDDRWLLSLPFAHVGGLSVVLRCLAARKTVVCEDLDARHSDFDRALGRLGVTLLSVVPTQLHSWCQLSEGPPASVRAILVGGSSCPTELFRLARCKNFPILRTYGLSEMSSQVATESPHADASTGRSLMGNVGRPLEGVEIEIRSQQQLYLRGPQSMLGYLEEAPHETFENGWFPTQDRARLESDGSLSILGRLDQVIISGGENISPESVEAALHPLFGVESLCVVGLTDPRWGERLVAAVVLLTSEMSSSPQQLVAEWHRVAEKRLPDYARPKAYYAVETLPLSEGGKIDRGALRDQLTQLVEEPLS